MKPFRERNLAVIGAIGIAVVLAAVVIGFNFTRIPFLSATETYSAYFDELGGLTSDAPVQVSGARAGQVQKVSLTQKGVLVEFTVNDSIRLGDRTEAAIKTKSLLGNKIIEVTPAAMDICPGLFRLSVPNRPTSCPMRWATSPRRSVG